MEATDTLCPPLPAAIPAAAAANVLLLLLLFALT